MAVISALTLLRMCSQWLSVCDVWRLQYSTHSHFLDIRNNTSGRESDGDDKGCENDLNRFVASGGKIGGYIGVIDIVLLHL